MEYATILLFVPILWKFEFFSCTYLYSTVSIQCEDYLKKKSCYLRAFSVDLWIYIDSTDDSIWNWSTVTFMNIMSDISAIKTLIDGWINMPSGWWVASLPFPLLPFSTVFFFFLLCWREENEFDFVIFFDAVCLSMMMMMMWFMQFAHIRAVLSRLSSCVHLIRHLKCISVTADCWCSLSTSRNVCSLMATELNIFFFCTLCFGWVDLYQEQDLCKVWNIRDVCMMKSAGYREW